MPRGRPFNIIPSRKLTLHLPETTAARMELFLVNPTLGKVPYGAYQKFLTDLVNEFFERTAQQSEGEQKDVQP